MSRARDHRCVFTGLTADALHHVTGTDANGRYYDPLLVIPLILRQHCLEHQSWHVLGIGEGCRADSLLIRLRRISSGLGRLGEVHGTGVIVLPVESVLELSRTLWAIAAEMERRS